MLETTRQDVKIGLRVLRRDRSFAAIAIAVLAIGICAVATQFAVVQGAILRGFSFPNADRLTSVQFVDPSRSTPFGTFNQLFSLDYVDLAAEQTTFERMSAFLNGSTVNLTIDGRAQRLTGAYVTEDFLRVLGESPLVGRDLEAADNVPGAPKVAIVSHALWQRDFGGDAAAIGKAVRINGRPATIVGVMQPGFEFPQNEQIWIPLFNEFPPVPRNDPNAAGNTVQIIATTRPGVSVEQANADVDRIAARLAAAYPESNKAFGTGKVEPLIETFTPLQLRGMLFTMLAFCVGVLLLACINVMNLQFARATLRARELAIRSSLGATRGRLVRQMLTESSLVAAIGAAIGVAGAYWTTGLLMDATHGLANPIPSYIVFRIDGAVLGAVVVAAALAALVSGLIPAWAASRANASAVLKDSGRGHSSRVLSFVNRALVVFQIVVTTILLVGSALQLQSIRKQQQVDYGYDTGGVLSARLGLMEGAYPDMPSKIAFFDRALRELRANPEYEGAALTTRFQMLFTGGSPIEIEGETYAAAQDRPNANAEGISDGYLALLGARILEGRDFTPADDDVTHPVAVVNAGFARKHFGTGSALGRRFRTTDLNGETFGPWRTIIGVVTDLRMTGPFPNPVFDGTGYYVPFFGNAFGPQLTAPAAPQFATVLVKPRPGRAAETLANTLLADIAKLDPDLPPYFVATPAANIDSVLGQNRVVATMFSLFGLVAVVLSAVGLYGLMSFSVNQRRQEFGTRMVLGAEQQSILKMVLRQGFTQLGIGLAIGLGLSLAIAFVGGDGLRQVLFQVDPKSPAIYAAVATLLALVALAATLVPARRATRVDPATALRAE